MKNIPGTSTKVDVANWRQSKFGAVKIPIPKQFQWRLALFIGVLKEKEEKKKKEKGNQYKLKKAVATPLA